jgi:hypothetical protein
LLASRATLEEDGENIVKEQRLNEISKVLSELESFVEKKDFVL